MRNWYKEIDPSLLPPTIKLRGSEKTGIRSAPFFLLISGRSGLGKTNALIELLHRQDKSYDKIILCCMNFLADPLYVAMKHLNPDTVDVYEREVPSVDDYAGDGDAKLIIFDDMVGKKEFEPAINDWFVRGRKVGASMAFITQSYFNVNTLIRRSLSDLYLFPSSSSRELRTILHDFPFIENEHKDIIRRFQAIRKTDSPSDFMNVSVPNATACINFELFDKRGGDKK
jgi:hypothetical protein